MTSNYHGIWFVYVFVTLNTFLLSRNVSFCSISFLEQILLRVDRLVAGENIKTVVDFFWVFCRKAHESLSSLLSHSTHSSCMYDIRLETVSRRAFDVRKEEEEEEVQRTLNKNSGEFRWKIILLIKIRIFLIIIKFHNFSCLSKFPLNLHANVVANFLAVAQQFVRSAPKNPQKVQTKSKSLNLIHCENFKNVQNSLFSS